MIILLICVLIIVVLLFILERDKINVLKLLGITFIITGSFMIVFGILFKIIIKSNITFINISSGINFIVYKFMIISIIFYVCGIISYIGYYLLKKV